MNLQKAIENRWYANSPGCLWLLLPLAWLFGVISRKRKYRSQAAANSHGIPVVVVGNISVGGTGKTPLIIALVNLLKQRNIRAGVVSRGYGRQSKGLHVVTDKSTVIQVGDEPLEIFRRCRCPVVVCNNRDEAVHYFSQKNPSLVDILLSDDGLQHYAMARQLEMVVCNAQQGFGNGHLLPVGPLREPIARANTVDFVLVNNNTDEKAKTVHVSLDQVDSDKCVDFSLHASHWVNLSSGEHRAISSDITQPVKAYAGIGQPERFFLTLDSLGIAYQGSAKPDHANYCADDFADTSIKTYLMTAKDAVKCEAFSTPNMWYLEIDAMLPDAFKKQFIHQAQNLIQTMKVSRHPEIEGSHEL